jgi:hypothetical protein
MLLRLQMDLPELVPLEVLFGNPDKAAAQASLELCHVACQLAFCHISLHNLKVLPGSTTMKQNNL